MKAGAGTRRNGTVIRLEGRTVIVRVQGEEFRAQLRGQLKSGPRRATHPVATGDAVSVAIEPSGSAVVERVEARRNLVARVDPGDPRRCHAIAANVDQLLCIQSFRDPLLNLRAVDRFLLIGQAAGIPATLVVNKLDLRNGPAPPQLAFYPQIGVAVLETSARRGEGIDPLRELLAGRRSVLVGPSGSGKSSLLNAAIPGLHLRTESISRATSKGVHTTTRVEWIDLPGGGVVLDTPGLRAIQPWGIEPANLARAFPEFRDLPGCRFEDCLHRTEPGCTVRSRIETGRLPAFRYDSYLRILASLLVERKRSRR